MFCPSSFFFFFSSVFCTFYITAAHRSPTQRSGLCRFRCCINKELQQTFKVWKHLHFMRRYFTTIIIANVVSSCLHSYSGFDPCVGGQPLRSAVIPWNIISPPTCYCLLSLFPHLCFGKRKKKKKRKQYHGTIFGIRCTIGEDLSNQKITLKHEPSQNSPNPPKYSESFNFKHRKNHTMVGDTTQVPIVRHVLTDQLDQSRDKWDKFCLQQNQTTKLLLASLKE